MFVLIFHPDAEKEIYDLDNIIQGKVFAALDKLETQGSQLRYPHTDIVQTGLFELRVGNKDITRTFFAFAKEKRIYILRTFVKKTAKTPKQEIEIAIKRLEELTDEN